MLAVRAKPSAAAKLVLTVLSVLVVLFAGYFLVLLQHLPVDAFSAGLKPGAIGIQNLLVILALCSVIRPPVWFFCLLGAGDVAMALNVWEFLSDVANDTWPSVFNLSLAMVWTRAGGEVAGLLIFSKVLLCAFLLKAVLTIWVGCHLHKNIG